jgi:hypothetical protein
VSTTVPPLLDVPTGVMVGERGKESESTVLTERGDPPSLPVAAVLVPVVPVPVLLPPVLVLVGLRLPLETTEVQSNTSLA